MMHAFIAGELVRDPEKRQTKAGNDYVTAPMRAGEDLVSVTAFDTELVKRLLDLRKGEPLSVSGRLAVSAYTGKDGEPKAGLSITASELMTATARRAAAKPKERSRAHEAPFDDAIPF